jgi:hypothetical protein
LEGQDYLLPSEESTEKLEACFYYNAFMEAPPTDRRAVEAAVIALQGRLADGDPADAALRSYCESVLLALRAAYRVNPAAFSREAIEALREFSELLHETAPAPHAGAPVSRAA